VSLGLAFAWARSAHAQADLCRDDITDSDGYAIRAMRVDARWAPQLPLPTGEYSPDKVAEAIGIVRTALDADRNRDTEIEGVGAVSILHIDSCVRVVDEATCQDAVGNPKCLDVAIRPHALRVFLVRVGSNVLPIPRPNRPTFFNEVPAQLLALNPTFATAYDRARTLAERGPRRQSPGHSQDPPGRAHHAGQSQLQLQASGGNP
jgi:hypothetical protein